MNEFNLLEINKNEILTITPHDNIKLEEVYGCQFIKITYHNKITNKQIIIFNELLEFGLDSPIYIINKAIQGNLKLHPSIYDIGRMWSKEWLPKEHKNNSLIYEGNFWVGQSYLVWSTTTKETWLYQKNDKFYIEITPVFNWSHTTKSSENKKYTKFLQKYKPYVITEISREHLVIWLEKLNKLFSSMESNNAKCIANYYKNNKSESYCNINNV